MLDGFAFETYYNKWLDEILDVIKPEYQYIIDDLKKRNPYELVRPHTRVDNWDSARSSAWNVFLDKYYYDHNLMTHFIYNRNMVDAVTFANNYNKFLNEISDFIKPEYQYIIDDLKKDPYKLLKPETWFYDWHSARGSVWNVFLHKVKLSKR